MRIRWKHKFALITYTEKEGCKDEFDYDEAEVNAGETEDVDIIGEDEEQNTVAMQFGNGSVTLAINRGMFETV